MGNKELTKSKNQPFNTDQQTQHKQQISPPIIEPTKQSFTSVYKFSQELKSPKVKVRFNDKSAAISSMNLTHQFVLIDSLQPIKNASIRLKIQYIGMNVAVGLCLRDPIANNFFQFTKWQQPGNSCFMLCSDGYTLSHSHQQNNTRNTHNTFHRGDIIRIQPKQHQILFVNQTQNYHCLQKIFLSQQEWQQASFAVLLTGSGDQVQIV